MAIVTASLVGAAVASALAFLLRAVPVPPRVSRLQIKTSGANGLSVDGVTSDIAVTPDGSRLVYVGGNGTALFVRSLDRLDPTAVTGLRSPRDPFVSPDGQWVGFFERSAVRKVGIGGGTPVALTPLDGPPRGASWGPDDTIVFATGNETTGLRRVSAAGGEPDVLTRPDRARGEADHVWPEFLPGGGSVLFTIVPTTGAVDQAQIAVLDLQTRASRVLMSGGSFARYVRSGHLVYVAGGTLYAVPFDLPRLAVSGSPVPVVPQMATTPQGAADVAIARDGTMVYVPGDAAAFARTLVWVDRRGQETAIPVPPRAYDHLRVAPDGQRVAVYVADQQSDIWLWTFDRATLTRVTFDPGIDRCPVWLRDSGRIVFRSRQAGALDNIFVQSADGTGTAERLTDTPRPHTPTSMSPDGDRLVFTEGPAANENIMQLTLAGRAVTPLVQTPFAERNGEISRDGRWLAYESNASGQFEIYVRPFPDVNRGQWQVSTGGGTRPLWARSGQELFFLAASSALMRVGVERGSTWRATKPVQLFERRYYLGSLGNTDRSYDISPDGQHFLMIKQTDGSESPMLVVVQHWDEELKRLAPVK